MMMSMALVAVIVGFEPGNRQRTWPINYYEHAVTTASKRTTPSTRLTDQAIPKRRHRGFTCGGAASSRPYRAGPAN